MKNIWNIFRTFRTFRTFSTWSGAQLGDQSKSCIFLIFLI